MTKNVPYRSHEEIWVEVDKFRLRPGVAEYTNVPVDAVAIAELVLCLTPTPIRGLFSRYKQDAALAPDLNDILIDEEAYTQYESSQSWIDRRLRFSVAHEIGHYVLHGEEIAANRFHSLTEFKTWMGDRSKPISPEYQADEFAGRLLVPRETLLEWYDRYREKAVGNDPNWRQTFGARTHLAEKIAPRFGVSCQVIETRFDREGLWSQNNSEPRPSDDTGPSVDSAT